jgi:hypothetical protein
LNNSGSLFCSPIMGTEPYQIAQTLCTIIFTLGSIWATRPEDQTPNLFTWVDGPIGGGSR